MNPTTRLFPIACLGALLVTLGCASATKSPDPARAKVDRMPAASTEPEAEFAPREPGAATLEPIYFETDRALVREDARETLKRHALAIQQHAEWGVVTIEGHCDERGSDEYNLALGDRRAAAVARYLSDLGVPSSRFQTRTYGEARPAVAGHDETAWRQNRRAELQSEAYDSARR
jgi:peptidoglycan-associated lipoprotein